MADQEEDLAAYTRAMKRQLAKMRRDLEQWAEELHKLPAAEQLRILATLDDDHRRFMRLLDRQEAKARRELKRTQQEARSKKK